MQRDTEDDAVEIQYVHGYASLAAFIARDLGHSTTIYRRFDYLSARSILFLQSELAELEAKLRAFDQEDLANDADEDNDTTRDFDAFMKQAQDVRTREAKRLQLLKDVQVKLKEYREVIVLESAMLSMQKPSKQAYTALHNTFWAKDRRGDPFPMLEGNSANILEDQNDLMALRRPIDEDRLTKLLRSRFAIFFPERTSKLDRNVVQISERRISTFVGAINVFLASAFLFGAIYNLYYVQAPEKTLALITAYTVAFALTISLLTNARRAEIFGACAAYAAVLVVFVSGNLGNQVLACSSCSPTSTGVG